MKKVVWSLLSLLSILSLLYCHYRHYCHISRYVGRQVLGRFKLPFDTFFTKVSDGRTDGPTETQMFRAALQCGATIYTLPENHWFPVRVVFLRFFLFILQQNRFYQVCHVFELTKCIFSCPGQPQKSSCRSVGWLVRWSDTFRVSNGNLNLPTYLYMGQQ